MKEGDQIPPIKEAIGRTTRDVHVQHVATHHSLGSVQKENLLIPENIVKGIAEIATCTWKAKAKMMDESSGEVREEMKRVYRHIEGILASFGAMGVEVKDHTGDPFDYGLPLKVVTTQPTAGINKERIVETIRPTIYWQKQIIQMGEVVIATPA